MVETMHRTVGLEVRVKAGNRDWILDFFSFLQERDVKHACVSKGKTIKGDKKALEKLGDCILHIWKLVLGSFSGAQETDKFNLEHGRK